MGRFHYPCPLRWSDLDAFGHVNNSRFLTLYEEARVALMFVEARKGGVTGFEEGVVVSRHEIDYLLPVDYTDSVHIEMWIEEIRASRFTIAYEMFDGGSGAGVAWTEERRERSDRSDEGRRRLEGPGTRVSGASASSGAVVSRARTVCVPFDLANGRPRRLSAAERDFLEPWQE